MKIRKANVEINGQMITNVYVYENKKEEYTIVSIPEIEWSTLISYEDDHELLRKRLIESLEGKTGAAAEQLTFKIIQWVREM